MKLKNIKRKKDLGMWAWVTLRSKPFKKTLMHILARLASIFCYFFLKSEWRDKSHISHNPTTIDLPGKLEGFLKNLFQSNFIQKHFKNIIKTYISHLITLKHPKITKKKKINWILKFKTKLDLSFSPCLNGTTTSNEIFLRKETHWHKIVFFSGRIMVYW
jgi:hypothetical protein